MTKLKKAFILMPFEHPYDTYYTKIYKRALKSLEYTVTRADDLSGPRPILMDIQHEILECDLLLCELSGRNPNVFYELGMAHAIGKPAILLANKKKDIPFDLSHIRAIIYDTKVAGWEKQLIRSIKASAKSIGGSEYTWPLALAGQTRNTQEIVKTISSQLEKLLIKGIKLSKSVSTADYSEKKRVDREIVNLSKSISQKTMQFHLPDHERRRLKILEYAYLEKENEEIARELKENLNYVSQVCRMAGLPTKRSRGT